jgi:aerobic carbon-monoxide dehydrogenase small subunit
LDQGETLFHKEQSFLTINQGRLTHYKSGWSKTILREEDNMTTVSMTVNGKNVTADIKPNTLLVQFIRDNLRLTGTHVGCDTSQCGSCTVHVNGDSMKSCTMLAVQADGADVTTIEGLAANGELHPMQASFKENHGLQCGFCTPGMIMSAVDLVKRNPNPSEETIRAELEGNICRCTGYHNIVKSVKAAAENMGG